MKPDKPARPHEQELRGLESRIDDLIHCCERLHTENTLLHTQNAALLNERLHLIEKNDRARHQVESMIMRLKTMELDS